MVTLKANIKLYNKEFGRNSPIGTGYRPAFNFIEKMQTSGQITLIDRELFYPGDEGEVEIKFIFRELLGDDFGIGKKFTFNEGPNPIGEGFVTEIISITD